MKEKRQISDPARRKERSQRCDMRQIAFVINKGKIKKQELDKKQDWEGERESNQRLEALRQQKGFVSLPQAVGESRRKTGRCGQLQSSTLVGAQEKRGNHAPRGAWGQGKMYNWRKGTSGIEKATSGRKFVNPDRGNRGKIHAPHLKDKRGPTRKLPFCGRRRRSKRKRSP